MTINFVTSELPSLRRGEIQIIQDTATSHSFNCIMKYLIIEEAVKIRDVSWYSQTRSNLLHLRIPLQEIIFANSESLNKQFVFCEDTLASREGNNTNNLCLHQPTATLSGDALKFIVVIFQKMIFSPSKVLLLLSLIFLQATAQSQVREGRVGTYSDWLDHFFTKTDIRRTVTTSTGCLLEASHQQMKNAWIMTGAESLTVGLSFTTTSPPTTIFTSMVSSSYLSVIFEYLVVMLRLHQVLGV